jgi:hypothetical protein
MNQLLSHSRPARQINRDVRLIRSWAAGPWRFVADRRVNRHFIQGADGLYLGPYVCGVCGRIAHLGVFYLTEVSEWACASCRRAKRAGSTLSEAFTGHFSERLDRMEGQ